MSQKNKTFILLFSVIVLTLTFASSASADTTITPLPYELATTTGWKVQETAYGNAVLPIDLEQFIIDEDIEPMLQLTLPLQNRGNMWNYDNAPGACLVALLGHYDGTDHDIAYSNVDCISNQGNNIFLHTFTWATTTLISSQGLDYWFKVYFTSSGAPDPNSMNQMAMFTYNSANPGGTSLLIDGEVPPDTTKYIYLYHPTSSETLADFSTWGTRHYYGSDNTEYEYSKICINYGTSSSAYSNCQWTGPLDSSYGMGLEYTWSVMKTKLLENGTWWANAYLYGYDGSAYTFLASSSQITFTINAPLAPDSYYFEYLEQFSTFTSSTDPCPNTGWFNSSTLSELRCEIVHGTKEILSWLFIPPTSTFAFVGDQYDKVKNIFPFVLVFGINDRIQDYIASSTTSTIGGISIVTPATPRFTSTTIQIFSSSGLAESTSIGQTAYNAYANFVLIALASVMVVVLISLI